MVMQYQPVLFSDKRETFLSTLLHARVFSSWVYVWYCLYHITLFKNVIHNMFAFIIRNNKDMHYQRQQLPCEPFRWHW